MLPSMETVRALFMMWLTALLFEFIPPAVYAAPAQSAGNVHFG